MSDIIYLSKKGYEDLKNELNKLKTIDRPRVINQIAEARDKGDLSENAEYDAAKAVSYTHLTLPTILHV